MVRLAHSITAETLPPLSPRSRSSRRMPRSTAEDFFEPGGSERLGDTPCVAARIWRQGGQAPPHRQRRRERGPQQEQAGISLGRPARRPQAHHHRAAQGQPGLRRYHRRLPRALPIAPGHPLESNRVDIGVFVNGHYFSAPAFITFFSLDNEART
ncbi:MAG: hypothetical protein U0793_21015 [Gemmataceae bacterium]